MTIKEILEEHGYSQSYNDRGYLTWDAPDSSASCEFFSENDAFAHLIGKMFLTQSPTFITISFMLNAFSGLLEVWEKQKEED